MNKFYKINLIIDGFLLIGVFCAICFIPFTFKYYPKDNFLVDYTFAVAIVLAVIQIFLNIVYLIYSILVKKYKNILYSLLYILLLVCFVVINYFLSMIMLVRGL